jgi:hypothetical protein
MDVTYEKPPHVIVSSEIVLPQNMTLRFVYTC